MDLVCFFENIISDRCDWEKETIAATGGFLYFLNSFENHYMLFSKIFAFSDTLFDILQNKTLYICYCTLKINETTNQLKTLNSPV